MSSRCTPRYLTSDHDSDFDVVMDISVHPSIAAIREECVAAQFEFDHVSVAETELILQSLDPNKATGHDQISARVLRDGASVLATPIARLMNTVIDNACVPAEWKLAEICPIFKRDDEFDKSKYRPVSILVLLDKVFERCVQKQLVHYFNPHLSKFLSAYRKGCSCESVLLHLIEDWKGALDKNSVVGTVIMDLSKAFDLIPHDLLLAKLSAYGITTHSLNLLKSYLTNRRQRVRVEDVTSDISYVNSGVPQGSVLGPLLFNIFINDLFYFIKEAKLSNYADDNQLYFADSDPAVVEHVVNKELVVVCEWFRNNKMILNPEKCKALVLSRKPNVKLSLFAEGVALPQLDTVDLFGLTLDNSMNFGKHITKISKKVGKQLGVLCRLKNILSFRTKLCLYNSFIMSHFHYCSSIWHSCLKSDSNKLDRLHERALRYLYSDESSQTSTLVIVLVTALWIDVSRTC